MTDSTMIKRMDELISAMLIDWNLDDIDFIHPRSAYMVAGYLSAKISTAYGIAQDIKREIQEDMDRTEAYWKEYKEKEAIDED